MLCLAAAAQAQDGCGSGEASFGLVKMSVIQTQWDSERRETYVWVTAPNPDGSLVLSVNYDPTGAELGPPTRLGVNVYVRLSGPGEPEYEQIAWRSGSGAWFNPGYWGNLQRVPEARVPTGLLSYEMARSQGFPRRIELLQALGQGIRLEFRRVNRAGRELGGAFADFPEPQIIAGLYKKARTQALGNLKPCRPPVYARPAPPSARR